MKRGVALVAVAAAVTSACVGGGVLDESESDTIEVFGPWRGADADRFADVLAVFEAGSGLDVRYVGSADFVADVQRRTSEESDPPDVAIVPQPGLIRELAMKEHIVPLDADVSEAVIENFGADNAPFGTVDDVLYAIPYRITIKSLVWYRPALFAANGWSVPESLEELEVLVARMEDFDGLDPWCLGVESGTATGWVATDWIEDLVLRSIGPEGYQRWVAGEITYADSDIADAFALFSSLTLASGRSFGGVRGVLQTPVSEAAFPLLADVAGCGLHRQADFAVNWLPDGTSIGPDGDIDFFIFPPANAGAEPPLVVGGDQVVQFRADPDVDALMTFLAGPEAAVIWARQGGFLSANERVPIAAYPTGHLRVLIDALKDSSVVVFDASDRLPPAIGSGLLWDRVTDWIAGIDDYEAFAASIDEAIADI